MEVGSAFIAGGEAPECVEPGEGAFDDVSDPAEAGSVGFATTYDAVLDAANGKSACGTCRSRIRGHDHCLLVVNPNACFVGHNSGAFLIPEFL